MTLSELKIVATEVTNARNSNTIPTLYVCSNAGSGAAPVLSDLHKLIPGWLLIYGDINAHRQLAVIRS